MTTSIIIGEGSYGKILYNKNQPGIVSKLHYLSSHEEETGCDEVFQHEFRAHKRLYSQLESYKNKQFIIPQPIDYRQEPGACVYNMEKMEYPRLKLFKSIIRSDRLDCFAKTNIEVHPPPYLLFSATSDDCENGKVKLTDIDQVEYWNRLFYILHKCSALAETMIVHFFKLTIDIQIVLQDTEFLLCEKNKKLCIGMLDFNQVSDFDSRLQMASKRVPNYSTEYDIANTYLFLSGIDTGSILTDRNTKWKFLPTPHILPFTFFATIEKMIVKTPFVKPIFEIICSTIYKNEIDQIKWHGVFDKIMVWHEILVYGAVDTDLFERLNISYTSFDTKVANGLASKYAYFAREKLFGDMSSKFDDYYILTSVDDQHYLERMKHKQKIGVISENILDPIAYYDIMFQRLFIIKCLTQTGIENVSITKFEKLLKKNVSFVRLINFLLNRPKAKTQKVKKPTTSNTKRNKSDSD